MTNILYVNFSNFLGPKGVKSKMQVAITGRGNLEMAIRTFRKKTQKEGIIKEARRRKAYEKPSEEKKRRIEENITRKKRSRKGEYVA